jgi:hypothetical protein
MWTNLKFDLVYYLFLDGVSSLGGYLDEGGLS